MKESMQLATPEAASLNEDAEKLFERMMEEVDSRLSEVYPAAAEDSIELSLTPTKNGDSAYLTYTVNDSWIDEEQVESIILSVAGESWVGFERESPTRFLLT